MSHPDTTDSPSWSAMVVAVFGWSLSAALGWSLFDALPLADEEGVHYARAWSAAVYNGVKAGVAAIPVGLAAGWLWHRSRPGHRLRRLLADRPAASGAVVVAVTIGWILLSFATYGSLTVYRQTFGSELVHKLAISITVPATAIAVGLLIRAVAGPLQSLLERLDHRWAILGATVVTCVTLLTGWTVTLIELGKVIWQNLTPWVYVPFVLMPLCAVVGALAANARRARRASLMAGLVALGSAGFYYFGDTSDDLELALVYRQTGAGLIAEVTDPGERHQFAAAEANTDQTAVCDPDVEPPELGDVGHVDHQAPDIIWLTVDAIRWENTSMAGYERDTTPNLAEHADRAAVFERAHTPASSTRQTMRALFTGTYPSMIDPPVGSIYIMTLDETQNTLAEYKRAAGYHTSAYSSDGYIFSQDHGAMQGFSHIDEKPFELKDTQGWAAPYIVDNIIDQLDDARAGGPQFVYSHLMEPHDPYLVGPDPDVDWDHDGERIDQYDAALHFTDSQLDRLLDYVADRQDERPTYLVVTADHGEAFGEHGQWAHGSTVYQEEVHVPLMIWGPDIEPDRYDEPIGVIDLFPTLFELAGLETPRGHCGTSLQEVLTTDRQPEVRPVFVEQIPDRSRTFFSVGFIVGDDKLMIHPMADSVALYDLAEDPGETNDLSDDQPRRLEERLEQLRAFMHERGMDPADYGIEEPRE